MNIDHLTQTPTSDKLREEGFWVKTFLAALQFNDVEPAINIADRALDAFLVRFRQGDRKRAVRISEPRQTGV